MAGDPRADQPVFLHRLDDGSFANAWYTDTDTETQPDACDVCRGGGCVQLVLRRSDWDSDVIVHDARAANS